MVAAKATFFLLLAAILVGDAVGQDSPDTPETIINNIQQPLNTVADTLNALSTNDINSINNFQSNGLATIVQALAEATTNAIGTASGLLGNITGSLGTLADSLLQTIIGLLKQLLGLFNTLLNTIGLQKPRDSSAPSQAQLIEVQTQLITILNKLVVDVVDPFLAGLFNGTGPQGGVISNLLNTSQNKLFSALSDPVGMMCQISQQSPSSTSNPAAALVLSGVRKVTGNFIARGCRLLDIVCPLVTLPKAKQVAASTTCGN